MAAKIEGIYVPLDVLLDTRIGTVARHFGDAVAIEVLENGYHSREDDNYPAVLKALELKAQEAGTEVDVDTFKRLYSARDVETLKLSTLTNSVELIAKTIIAVLERAIESPYSTKFKVTVNTYPYELSAEEMTQISAVIAGKLSDLVSAGVPIEIETTAIPLSALTPSFCKDRFVALIMYEYAEWVELQHKGLIKLPIPEITLITPAIYHEKTPTLTELRESIEQLSHPMHVMYEALKPYVRLDLIDVSYFSLVTLPKPTA